MALPNDLNVATDANPGRHPSAQVRRVFAEGGELARALDGYEPRDGQQRMAVAVAAAIEQGGTLLAEAGTGTGKTLAYLVPALLCGHRVLVSTGTKNLQEQIFFKDLPVLQEALGLKFTATLMKGRTNYLCLHRWAMYRDGVEGNTSAGGRLIESGDRLLVPVVERWLQTTRTGDRAELRDVPEDLPIWRDISADADTCLGSDCPRHGDCFVTTMRQRAAEADVVIVNHHLLCADASVRQHELGEVIPSCPTLVVDESHQLEEIATQYFGISFSNLRVDDLVRDGERLVAARPLATIDEMRRALERVSDRARAFFAGLTAGEPRVIRMEPDALARSGAGAADRRMRYTAESIAGHVEEGAMLAGALEGLEATLALSDRPGETAGEARSTNAARHQPDAAVEAAEAIAALARRAGELKADLRFLLRAADPDFVYYGEMRGRGIFLRASPIDVSGTVRQAIFDRFRTVVLTSATMTVDGSFEYVKSRLGVRGAEQVRVPSEFDYARQTLLYLPRRMPPPRSPGFAEAVARESIEILKRSRGRGFVLFTSYAVLRVVQRFVEMALPYPILVQGTAPRSALLEEFRATPNSVLLATSSFWQGVDVMGDALSCVIIDKLPFSSPSDPVTAARIDAISDRGGDPFADYQVPLAILSLQQGLGRLIRHRRDRGVLAVLDPRLRTMGYGRRFLASLPPAPVTYDLAAVGDFFM